MSIRIALPMPADHPAFAGHFPGRPIVPGALLIDMAIAAIEARTGREVTQIAQAKFLSPAVPGEVLEVEFAVSDNALRLEVQTGGRCLATARLNLRP
jgi:3-hydroxyacyl-[acyl-carrier-protein] dehydratase